MATLADLKAEIADDLVRGDLTSQIASAISSAIRHYQSKRFYFNETRDTTFSTVAAQQKYDSATIAAMIDIDDVSVVVSGLNRSLDIYTPTRMEQLSDASAMSGQPYAYSVLAKAVYLYPIPDQVYTVRMIGLVKKDEPASDGETGNVWMDEAYELIRCRAKKMLGLHVLKNPELVAGMDAAERMAADELFSQTNSRMGTGQIVPTCF